MSNHDDDDNPMHRIGHGRGDDHASRKTAAYSFVDPVRIVNVGDKKVDPTQPMEAVDILATETLTVKDIIHRLLERNLQAWRSLPESIRDRMLDRPQDFHLIGNKQRKDGDFDYNILYNGTVWCYSSTHNVWTIHSIVR